MEEYEIRDVTRRIEAPDLRAAFELVADPSNPHSIPGSISFFLQPTITNDALEPAKYAVIDLLIDTRIEVQESAELQYLGNLAASVSEDRSKTHPVNVYRYIWRVPINIPIFQTKFNITGRPLKLGFSKLPPGVKATTC